MWDLSKHEKLEMEVLEGLNSLKVLNNIIFCGGTMLRLCHELNRYSVDLDFWYTDREKEDYLKETVGGYLRSRFKLRPARTVKGSIVFDFAADKYPRDLKVELRRADRPIRAEERIAFSRHSNIQVMLKTATLEEMMRSKIETFLSRMQIRDVFDIEFLYKKGVAMDAPKNELAELAKHIRRFKIRDYKVTLGSLLEFKERQHYKTANFKLLLGHIDKFTGEGGK